MDEKTMVQTLRAARLAKVRLVDVTGGAPEMHPRFRWFVRQARKAGFSVQVHTNLTVLADPCFEEIPEYLAAQGVWLVGSLPCYLRENVEAQRGAGAYAASIAALRRLNALGYGLREDLPLDLVYNPLGPALPPKQGNLEEAYRRELCEHWGISFTRLRTITNMPLGRFSDQLLRNGQARAYQELLERSFNARTLPHLMCRHQISVGWNGTVHDCDFNLALGLAVDHGAPSRIADFDAEALARRRIVTGDHCFGCTAGCGSSCAGALSEREEQE